MAKLKVVVGDGKYRSGPTIVNEFVFTEEDVIWNIGFRAKSCTERENRGHACSQLEVTFLEDENLQRIYRCLKFNKDLKQMIDDEYQPYVHVCEECQKEYQEEYNDL